MSKEKSVEEIREEFLSHVHNLVDYWNNVDERSTKEKLSGLAFSILSTLDGCSAELPSFIVAPLPHEDDKQYHINNGDDYYPENHNSNVNCDIAGELHELFYKE